VGKKLLLVEDDPTAIRITTYALERAGYEVLVATNGREGLDKARDSQPDLIVLDVMLPGLDGFEVCRSLREDSPSCEMPILMLSAKAQESDIRTGLNVGANFYLTKPAAPAELLRLIEALLELKTPQPK
jgi:two-component system alkaline phosphatase synthesis response regulator PhoP